jgi:hypothetical protein
MNEIRPNGALLKLKDKSSRRTEKNRSIPHHSPAPFLSISLFLTAAAVVTADMDMFRYRKLSWLANLTAGEFLLEAKEKKKKV